MNWDQILREAFRDGGGYDKDQTPAELVLDANERTADVPKSIKEECLRRLREEPWNRYPDKSYRSLRSAWSDYLHVPSDRIIPGNGSDEIISYLMTVCLEPGDTVLVPEPTFSMYGLLANQNHAKVRTVPLDDEWQLSDGFFREAEKADLVFVGSPNNPTGSTVSKEELRRLTDSSSGLVVVDEAYVEFAGDSLTSLVESDRNLAVLRTLSKAFGLAAIRVGALVAPAPLREALEAARLPYNVNRLSRVVAEVGLNQAEDLLEFTTEVQSERERISTELRSHGLEPEPSEANFVLFRCSDANGLYQALLEEGVRIRRFDEERLSDYLRVTVGHRAANDVFLTALKEAVDST